MRKSRKERTTRRDTGESDRVMLPIPPPVWPEREAAGGDGTAAERSREVSRSDGDEEEEETSTKSEWALLGLAGVYWAGPHTEENQHELPNLPSEGST